MAEDFFEYNNIEIPTVVGLLRNVLSQYPDNGQILKELVQNAEDAGATRFEVVHDPRSKSSGIEDVRRFIESPSLFVYNNAEFSDEDWHGIRMLSDSIKRDDLLKVGQFGLGFKSVFHFTDYVTIISGRRVLFMDPSEPESKMCRSLPLEKICKVISENDCLDLWGLHLQKVHLRDGYFPGTIFWFPLRRKESDISPKMYVQSNVEALFRSFSVEAPLCLTFLKSLESISVTSILQNGSRNNILKVDLNTTSLDLARERRTLFKNQLQACNGFPTDPITCKYDITVDTNHSGRVVSQHYKILHYLPCTEGNQNNTHMPLVGIAAPVPLVKQDAQGQIFCFLPLPLETVNNTGLPVQINGYFVLDQNRRHVKWRTEESSSEPDIIWNEELVRNVLTTAYFHLLKDLCTEVQNESLSVDIWYSLLPGTERTSSTHTVTGRWKNLSIEIWRNLVNLPIVYSSVRKMMMCPKEVYSTANMLSLGTDVSKSVRKVMKDVGFPLAKIPQSIETTLRSLGAEPKAVTPSLLRECLKNNLIRSDWNKLLLLQYVLSDGRYGDLDGIELLPLQNNTWIRFSRSGTPLFICTKEQAAAFIGAEHRLLTTTLEYEVLQHLRTLANTGGSSLKIFDPKTHTLELLELSVAHIQKKSFSHQQLNDWLQSVWCQVKFMRSLQPLECLPLIPSSDILTTRNLLSLTSPIVVNNLNMSKEYVEGLRLLKIEVLDRWPSYIHHPDIHLYYGGIDTNGVLRAMENMLKLQDVNTVVCDFNKKCTNEQRMAICNEFTSVHGISCKVRHFLRKLNLFKVAGTENFVCVDNVPRIYPLVKDFPVRISASMIDSNSLTMRNLALTLGAEQLAKEDICVMALQYKLSDHDAEKLGMYIISDKELSINKDIANLLKNLKFISTVSGQLCLPNQLYDPFDKHKDALLEEGLFPSDKYKPFLSVLKHLGMKPVGEMTRHELIAIIKGISTKNLDKKDFETKLKTLLVVIDDRADCPEICEAIRNVKCIKGVSERPSDYPRNLDWATKNDIYKPSEVRSFQLFNNVVGSVLPLVSSYNIPNVSHCFGWNEDPSVNEMIQHFRKICVACPVPMKVPGSIYYSHIKRFYEILNGFVGTKKQKSLYQLSQEAFVFTASGFKLPSEVYLPSGQGDLQLMPYMHELPLDLCESRQLFCLLGSFENQSLTLFYKILRQIQSNHSLHGSSDIAHDLRVVTRVLEKISEYIDDVDLEQLLLPVETEDGNLEFVNVDKCAYSDQDCQWLNSEELGLKIIHRCISINLAKSLGVQPLNRHLLADEETVMEWGQHEPLTTRIHNLLRQYRDGVAVLKEMVQNADDAGATQIHFLYDERQNFDSNKRLITDKLKEFQGPALWSYNNATFTEKDFENLCKLGGATKEQQKTKIGKFGLGFCSVYNVTDVPSFVSGNSYIIFDPHKTYLERRQAGVRYNFEKKMNIIMLNQLHGQFQPFSNVFDCHIQETRNFEGTLFRLPLRTSSQATSSEISNQSYSHGDVVELLTMFREIVGEILLFTQNVKEIKVFHLDKNSPPQNMELLYESNLKSNPLSCGNAMLSHNIVENKPVDNAANLYTVDHKWKGKVYEECRLIDIQLISSTRCAQLMKSKEGKWSVTWLISWNSGSNESCKLAECFEGKVLSLACVALPVERRKELWQPKKLKNLPSGFYKESHMHCFLPLPVKTTLPVQVNGFFEVASDRTSLITRTEDDRNISQDWNKTLMKDAVNSAYVNLVSFLRERGLSKETRYFSLWPVVTEASDALLLQLASSFYKTVKCKDLEVFRNKYGWYGLSKCCFLSDKVYNDRDIGIIVFEFMGNLLKEKQKQVIELPQKIVASFGEEVSKSVIDEQEFYTEYFLPNLSHDYISFEKQNQVLLHLIDTHKPFLDKLNDICCIPTIPHGKLRKPSDLIDPESEVASLFDTFDERFPCREFMEGSRRNVLARLGMNSRQLDDDIIQDRVKSVKELPCFQCARARSLNILHYLNQNIPQTERIASHISHLAFIPIITKPAGWHLSWKGDTLSPKNYQTCDRHQKSPLNCSNFVSPNLVSSPELIRMIGSTYFIQDFKSTDGIYPKGLCKKIGIVTDMEDLPFPSVLSQLGEYRLHQHALKRTNLENACSDIYKYLDYQAKENENILDEVKNQEVLLTKFGFIETRYFAIKGDINCSPSLFSVEREGLSRYTAMIRSLGIPQIFSFQLVHEILLHKYDEFQHSKVPESEVSLISNLLLLLFQLRDQGESRPSAPEDLYLPDSQMVMRPVKDLCTDDGSKRMGKEFYFLNDKLHFSQEMLRWLGIEEKLRKHYRDSCRRLRFGQKEPLTTRLKNILDNYPCDTGIMKELLQNADDAGATEIAFIKDERHLPAEKLFDEKWAPLQGPALCVYNNKGFTMKDLEGIQNLGNSVKMDDPASTGQYGIGFNAVYHVTDAPSFLTRGQNISIECEGGIFEKETLCMFDPHCKYDPQATLEYPGVQLTDLNHMRRTYPDSFEGYLEDFLKEEGTMFRLPLRTCKNSEIGKPMTLWQLEKLLQDFKQDMKISLLFLKNVRKISIKKISKTGEISEDYSVEMHVQQEEKLNKLTDLLKNRKTENALGFFFNMQRLFYEVEIKDSNKGEYRWLIAQQLGADNTDSLPELVSQAFLERNLRLLPQGGVAVLLHSNSGDDKNLFKNFCFLPLPTESGFMLCLNGHFALDNSRRDLWIGKCDFKAEWNNWLMQHVLAPIIGEAIYHYRTMKFNQTKEFLLYEYKREIKHFTSILPSCRAAVSEKWKNLVTWVYRYVESHDLAIFDVFIPENDKASENELFGIGSYLPRIGSFLPRKPVKGKLIWHPLKKESTKFPVYFSEMDMESDSPILNTLKRLGMKIGSIQVCDILKEAGISTEMLNAENVITFLLSWEENFVDNCRPQINAEISRTPFLSVKNVVLLFEYISSAQNFSERLNRIPLLVCHDGILRHFDSNNPVFYTSYGWLLPHCQQEFIHTVLYSCMISRIISKKLPNIFKSFTLHDFANRLPSEYSSSKLLMNTPVEIKERLDWIRCVWKYISEETKRLYQKQQLDMSSSYDTKGARNHVINALGEKALYPVAQNESKYLIPVKEASLTLLVKPEDDKFYQNFPVPRPIPCFVPESLNLAATLKEPVSVLDVIYHWRHELETPWSPNGKLNFTTLLEYFGKFCGTSHLSVSKLSSLRIYEDVTGRLQNLESDFIVSTESVNKEKSFHVLCQRTGRVILKPKSTVEETLYKYVNSTCVMSDLELFSSFILPKLSELSESEFVDLLEFLRDVLIKLQHKDVHKWSNEERNAVLVLKRTPFITFGNKLVTADHFYDPSEEVFDIMIPTKLPDHWAQRKWQHFLRLAGLIHEVTGDLFVEFARSLSVRDENVGKKSKVLVACLCNHFRKITTVKGLDSRLSEIKGLDSRLSEIKEIEFLVPEFNPFLGKVFPYYRTESGLVSYSLSASSCHMDLVWTTMSILPRYANRLTEYFKDSKDVPEEKLFLHLCNITSVANCELDTVMENIYTHIESESNKTFLKRLQENRVPVIYLDKRQNFVPVDIVVINIIEEIEPYLYKAPVRFGSHFGLFQDLGVKDIANCDHYVHVLNMIHGSTHDKKLNPEESKCMKLAMKALVENMAKLQTIKAEILYLPSKHETLTKSSEMYVADNSVYERLTAKDLDKPLFVGLSALKIPKSDEQFVQNLPDALKPKLLSKAIDEIFDENVYEEVENPQVEKIREFLSCSKFKKGMKRFLNHFGLYPSGIEDKEMEMKIECIEVKALKKIAVNLVLNGNVSLKKREIPVHFELNNAGSFVLYISSGTSDPFLHKGLLSIYSKVFNFSSICERSTHTDAVCTFMGILNCLDDPSRITFYLDSSNIRAFGETDDPVDFFVTDIGSYLPPDFIELLDNNFCRFNEEEIVAMKKYLNGDDNPQVDIYIIVQVKKRISSSREIMNDKYEVFTGDKTIVIKAHMLYKFVRESKQESIHGSEVDGYKQELVLSNRDSDGTNENTASELSEEEIMKTIREQMKEIWRVEDEQERRHLVRRLMLKWHPDKNKDKEELCTRIFQYIQSLVRRLENGEDIPDDDDHRTSTTDPPSDFYRSAFRPPPNFSTHGSFRGRRNRFYSRPDFSRTKMPDRPEAMKWLKQAEHDYGEASAFHGRSSCWIVFMCYQASEKALKAALFAEDCEQAREIHSDNSQTHILSAILQHLSSPNLRNMCSLVSAIENRVGCYNNMQYPNYDRIPCDRYTPSDATFMLSKTNELLTIVKGLLQA